MCANDARQLLRAGVGSLASARGSTQVVAGEGCVPTQHLDVQRCHFPLEDRFPNRYHARRGLTSLWLPSHMRRLVDFP